jgi:hypothetical protein
LVGNSSVVANFQGKKFFTQFSQAFDEAPSNPFGKMCHMDSAGSVANCAYAFAKIIGMKTIAFVGQDLAYTGGVSHALGHQQREDKTPEAMEKDAGMKKVAGYHGDTVYTTIAMDVFKAWFEARFAEDKGITVLNCTEGGAFIEGFRNMSLETAITEYLPETTINFPEKIKKACQSMNRKLRIDQYVKVKNSFVHSIERTLDLVATCKALATKPKMKDKHRNKLNKTEKKLIHLT